MECNEEIGSQITSPSLIKPIRQKLSSSPLRYWNYFYMIKDFLCQWSVTWWIDFRRLFTVHFDCHEKKKTRSLLFYEDVNDSFQWSVLRSDSRLYMIFLWEFLGVAFKGGLGRISQCLHKSFGRPRPFFRARLCSRKVSKNKCTYHIFVDCQFLRSFGLRSLEEFKVFYFWGWNEAEIML